MLAAELRLQPGEDLSVDFVMGASVISNCVRFVGYLLCPAAITTRILTALDTNPCLNILLLTQATRILHWWHLDREGESKLKVDSY